MSDNDVMRPESFYSGDYEGTDNYIILAQDNKTILAVLYDKDGDAYCDASKNAELFANSWYMKQALKEIQDKINYECRDLIKKHPCKELFDSIDALIEKALDDE